MKPPLKKTKTKNSELQAQIKAFVALYDDVTDEEFNELPLKIRMLLQLGLAILAGHVCGIESDHVSPGDHVTLEPLVSRVPGVEIDPHEHLKLYKELSEQINQNYDIWASYAEKLLQLKERGRRGHPPLTTDILNRPPL